MVDSPEKPYQALSSNKDKRLE